MKEKLSKFTGVMKKGFSKTREGVKKINLKRNENSERFKMVNLFLTVLFPIFIVCMAEVNQHKHVSKFILFFAERPSVMLFNFLMAGLIFSGFLLLFRKGWIAVAAQSVLYMALSVTELFKYNTNGNHLIMTDMKLASNVKSLTSFAYIKITPELIIYISIVVLYFAAVFWFNPKLKMKLVKRIAPSLACLAACVCVIVVPVVSKPVYSLFDIDQTTADNTFKLNEKFENNSFLAFFCQTASENLANTLEMPENYNDETVAAMMDIDVEDEAFKNEKPNVIVIMSESFADFRRFEDKLDVDMSDTYKGFDNVAAKGYKGTAVVPTYASWTVRTEFELNFGLPVRSLNDPNMPQRMLIDREQPTVAAYYRNWGYKTTYIHPFMSEFYSRDKVYATMGFDDLIFDEDFTVPVTNYGTYIEDKTVFNQIEKLLKDTEEPMFIHTTTMQNHQPYNQGENPDDEMGNYLQWIGHSCDDFETFISNLENIDEPTVVVMIGDHFPSLRGEDSVYDQIGINGANCGVLNEQSFVVWNNCGLDYSQMPDETFSVFYLPYVIMDLVDAPRDSFIQAMMDKLETVPIYTTNYNPEIGRDNELDVLTYDRVLGDIVSSNPLPDEIDEDE